MTFTAVESTVALVISIGTAVFALIKYYKFEKRISKQEIALNDIQLAEFKKNEENLHKADIQLNLVTGSNGHRKMKVFNRGQATAENIEVQFLSDIRMLSNLKSTLNIEKLDHLQNKDYDIYLISGHPEEIRAQVSWKDDFSQNNTKTVTIFIQ